jgi:hypothetical protein
MNQDPFPRGSQVVHDKMQVIGTVITNINNQVFVELAKNVPVQVWKKNDVRPLDLRKEIQKRVSKGGYIRELFRKMDS